MLTSAASAGGSSLPGLRRLWGRPAAALDPAVPALVRSNGEELALGALAAAVLRAAATLLEMGARPGGVVGVAVPDPCGFIIAALAAWETGAALLPLDARIGAAAWEPLAVRARARLVVTDASPTGELAFNFLEPAATEFDPRCALLLFTSGSSGPPKGVLLGRSGLCRNVDAILGYLPIAAAPRTALVLPLTYGYALVGQALAALRAGAPLLLLGDLRFPALQLDAMARFGAHGLSSVPASLRLLARAAIEARDAGEEAEVPALRYLASAGAALDAGTTALLREAFPEARLFNQYGLTECSPRVAALGDDHPRFVEGALLPLPGVTLWAEDGLGHELPPGEQGRLHLRGGSTMLGYLDEPEATARVLRPDGALDTGDIGHVDTEGFLFVAGRADGVVKVAGERVGLEGVAALLRMPPAVRDAAVVAIPDEVLGVRLYAFVEGDENAAEQARAVARDLLPVRRPAKIIQLPALPRTRTGKVDQASLRALAEKARTTGSDPGAQRGGR